MEAPKLYGEVVDPWDQNPLGARQLAVNNVQKVRVSPAELLTVHKLWPRWIIRALNTLTFGGIWSGPSSEPGRGTQSYYGLTQILSMVLASPMRRALPRQSTGLSSFPGATRA